MNLQQFKKCSVLVLSSGLFLIFCWNSSIFSILSFADSDSPSDKMKKVAPKSSAQNSSFSSGTKLNENSSFPIVNPLIPIVWQSQIRQEIKVTELVKKIDDLTEKFWVKNKIKTAPIVSDDLFLRRISLDLIGRIPSLDEIREFQNDPNPAKRNVWIDRLLNRPEFASHFASLLKTEWVQEGKDFELQNQSRLFQKWLEKQIKDHQMMDKIVQEILTAPTLYSQNSMSMNSNSMGSVRNYPSPEAFLALNEYKPEMVASTVARIYMGIKLECCQCHNHPFASYKREQFWELAAFFAEVDPLYGSSEQIKYHRQINLGDTDKIVEAKYLTGELPKWEENISPRSTFVKWLVSKKNPYFALTGVNHLWQNFLGYGFFESTDEVVGEDGHLNSETNNVSRLKSTDSNKSDPKEGNAAENNPSSENIRIWANLEKVLADFYADSGFDYFQMIRAITRSKVYQLSSELSDPSQQNPRFYARMNIRHLTGRQVFNNFIQATGSRAPVPSENRFVFSQDNNGATAIMTTFQINGKKSEAQSTILQALLIMNGRFISKQTVLASSDTFAAVMDAPFLDIDQKINTLFLLTLNRSPTLKEFDQLRSMIDRETAQNNQVQAMSNLFWALLNSTEFVVNH